MKNNKGVLSNLSWKFAERITAQLVSTIVSIILARILAPTDYGTIAIVTIFITLANVLVSDGFGSALIQKKDADDLDFSSVFWFNIISSTCLYIILYFLAPVISRFYGSGYEILTPVLRVLGLRIIVAGINSVQQAYVSRHMIFKKFFVATLFGTVLSAFVGIYMAYRGFGVWSLVAQYLTNTTVDTIVLNLSLKWRPQLKMSLERLKTLLQFGIKILGTSLLITGYQELRALIVGKVYSSADLAFYDKGRQFPNLIVTNINTSIGAVLFPKMSREQDNIKQVKYTTRMSIRFSSFIMCPMMIGLAAIARQFVSIVLTDKWMPAVPLLQMFCIVYLFQPIHTANMQAIKALGRSDIYLKLEIFKKTIELVSLLICMWISVKAIVLSMAILTTMFAFVNAFPNRKLIDYSFREQMIDIVPNVLRALFMGAFVLLIGILPINRYMLVILQVLAGASVYILCSAISKNPEFYYIHNLILKRKYEYII